MFTAQIFLKWAIVYKHGNYCLATGKGVHMHQWGETVKFIYLIKGPGAYELPKVVECFTANFIVYWWWNVNHAAKFKICKLSNIEVAELAVWHCDGTKACFVLQASSCHLKSERTGAISLPPCLRRMQKCVARPGRRPRCGGWQQSGTGINLNASDMCWQMGEDLTN